MIKNSFLEKFDADPVWSVIWPGRAGKLSLQGPEGAIDLIVSYFHTGKEITEHDLFGLTPAARASCTSFAALRARLRIRIASSIAPRNSVLSVLGGDFNYANKNNARTSLGTASASTRDDSREEAQF